ncbi:MAG: polyphosphate kinase [Oligoflexia bacterium]|nr:polyphosphate kinase [Oligoflexia bacterium]
MTKASSKSKASADKTIRKLQLELLRIQEGLYHNKKRAIIVFEGFDAAGKGGAIRRLTEALDPRGIDVHPIGPPEPGEQERHWLYRFWTRLPKPGVIGIFDRSWYGRVLVERVESLTPKKDWKRAYSEINQFEAMLANDGVEIIKFFLKISKEEQLRRFEARLQDPYKHWKLTPADIEGRKKWADYVAAAEEMWKKTDTKQCPWHVIDANDKEYARLEVTRLTCKKLTAHGKWMEREAMVTDKKYVKEALAELRGTLR